MLCLVRPELFLLTFVVYIYLFSKSINKIKYAVLVLLSLFPLFFYYIYMYLYTGSLIPSSAYGRMVASIENNYTWIEAFRVSFFPLIENQKQYNFERFIYLLGFIFLVGIITAGKIRNFCKELLILISMLLPFIIFPPLDYAPRYLIPSTVVLSILIVKSIYTANNKYMKNIIVTALTIVIIFALHHQKNIEYNMYDYDTLLLYDLAEQLNTITTEKDKILIYEIQGQYYLKSACFSLDGIIGNQFPIFLTKEKDFLGYIKRNNINYIVTMNAFNYRKIFQGTFLVDLYEHDLVHKVGEKFAVDNLIFEKVITNQYFANQQLHSTIELPNLNRGKTIRVYNYTKPLWLNHTIMWNSVYRIYNNPTSL